MGQFVDSIIFKQESKELCNYLSSRDMKIIDVVTVLQNHLNMIQCESTLDMFNELKK